MDALNPSASEADEGRRNRPAAHVAALGLAALCAAAGMAGADELRGEYEVKAAFLVHFARLVEWPDSALGAEGEAFVIGVLGEAEGVREGRQTTSVSGRPVVVRRIADAQGVSSCRIVFVTAAERERTREILAAARGRSVLTVGEAEEFIEDGGIIRFFEDGRKIRFEINPTAAEPAGLRISSRLLRLSRRARKP